MSLYSMDLKLHARRGLVMLVLIQYCRPKKPRMPTWALEARAPHISCATFDKTHNPFFHLDNNRPCRDSSRLAIAPTVDGNLTFTIRSPIFNRRHHHLMVFSGLSSKAISEGKSSSSYEKRLCTPCPGPAITGWLGMPAAIP